MQEIQCPHCGKAFTIDEAGYAAIVQQVRDREFSQELARQTESAVKLSAAEKDAAILELRRGGGRGLRRAAAQMRAEEDHAENRREHHEDRDEVSPFLPCFQHIEAPCLSVGFF